MSRRKVPAAYKSFDNFLTKCKTLVSCVWPGCEEKMLVKSYQNHCKTFHGLDHSTRCAFCGGRRSWARNQKMQSGKHLHDCAQRFVRIYEANEPPGPSTLPQDEPSTLTLRPETVFPREEEAMFCSERCYAFRSPGNRPTFRAKWKARDWNEFGVRLLEEPLFESNPERLDFEIEEAKRKMDAARTDKEKWLALLNPLRFDSRSGLGRVHEWIRRFLWTRWTGKWTWYHLCVRAGCMKSFAKAVKGIEIVAAPYWCVCDGGIGFDEPSLQARTHHRHLIVAVRNKTLFRKAMEKKIEYRATGEAPKPGFKKYYSRLIDDANHFVNSVAYVSLPSSKCRCKRLFEKGKEDEWFLPYRNVPARPRRRHRGHYLVANDVNGHARWWMQLLIPCDGIDRYARFSIGSRGVYGMKSRLRKEKRWTLSAADEFDVKNCVVRFEPSDLKIDGARPIADLKSYVDSLFENLFGDPIYPDRENLNPFVYWFDGKKYPVRRMTERPPAFDDDAAFQEWHAARGINTLLNIGECDSRFEMSRNLVRHANDLERQKQDCEKDMNAQLGAMQRTFDEINQRLRNEAETEKKKYEECKKQFDDFLRDRFLVMERDFEDKKRRWEDEKRRWEDEKRRLEDENRRLANIVYRQHVA